MSSHAARTLAIALLALLVLLAAGCKTVSAKDQKLAQVKYDLSIQSQRAGDPRAALGELEGSLKLDAANPEAHNFHGLLLHLYFGQPDPAAAAYRRAIALKPDYSEAKVNLGAVLIAQDRCAEALPYLDDARKDLLFRDAHLAEGNFGWCKHKLGDSEAGIRHLMTAIGLNPRFCLGFRNLAELHDAKGDLATAAKFAAKYQKACPLEADADHRRGLLHLKAGEVCEARRSFLACRGKAKEGPLEEQCGRQVSLIADACGDEATVQAAPAEAP